MTSGWKDLAERQRLSRRSVVRGGALGAAGLAGAALIGCGGDDDTDPTGTAAPGGTTAPGGTAAPGGTTPPASGEPRPGGVLRHGMASDLTTLDPHPAILAHADTIWHVWDTLTKYDENLEPIGQLFESWEINEEQTEFIFHLRPGVTWHSGRPWESEDVRFNVERVKDPESGLAFLASMANWYDEPETPDENTVILRSDETRLATFDFFERFLMADRETVMDDPTVAIGTGSFMLGEWRPGDNFNLFKNPNYWREGYPLLDEQTFSLGIEQQTLQTQFDSNAIDIFPRPDVRDFIRHRDEGTAQALAVPGGSFYCIGYNTTFAPLDDKRVRQALTWAFDRDRFANTVLQGITEPFSLPWPEASIAYEADKANHYQFDPERARQMLDAAGVNDLDIEIVMTPEQSEQREMAEIYQADLADIGVNLRINQMETAAFVETINARPPQQQGLWFASSNRRNLGNPFSMFTTGAVLWSTDQHPDGYGMNNTGYYSDTYRDLLAEVTMETDMERARDLYSQINDLLLDDCFIFSIAPRPPRLLAQNNVRDIHVNPASDGYWMYEAWLDS